ncbi:MAG: CtsR family transcriptional regulator [Clostridia bacterium]
MKISDIIEQFIIDIIGEGEVADISRNELASYFRCAPSQINYVLQTRFTLDRGFQVESQRGGGGYIRIERLAIDKNPYLYSLLETLSEPISYTRLLQIAECLVENGIMLPEEGALLTRMTSDKALATPSNNSDSIRSNILKETIIHLIKR